jgi:hypothetical protein
MSHNCGEPEIVPDLAVIGSWMNRPVADQSEKKECLKRNAYY